MAPVSGCRGGLSARPGAAGVRWSPWAVEAEAVLRHGLPGAGGRGDVRPQQGAEAAWDAGRQRDQGEQAVTAGLGALPPPLKLAGVDAQARGQTVPREAAGLLEALQALGKVLRQEGDAEQEPGRGHRAAPHSSSSTMNSSWKSVAPSISMSRLRSSGDGHRLPPTSRET